MGADRCEHLQRGDNDQRGHFASWQQRHRGLTRHRRGYKQRDAVLQPDRHLHSLEHHQRHRHLAEEQHRHPDPQRRQHLHRKHHRRHRHVARRHGDERLRQRRPDECRAIGNSRTQRLQQHHRLPLWQRRRCDPEQQCDDGCDPDDQRQLRALSTPPASRTAARSPFRSSRPEPASRFSPARTPTAASPPSAQGCCKSATVAPPARWAPVR